METPFHWHPANPPTPSLGNGLSSAGGTLGIGAGRSIMMYLLFT